MGRQITRFTLGLVASSIYPRLPHEEKLIFQMALAFQACWTIPLPGPHMIGELSARESKTHTGRLALVALEKQQGIQEYHKGYLDRIQAFVANHLNKIPAVAEDIPLVALHADMGLHNVIVSNHAHTLIQAIIGWEFIASAPYASLHQIIEMLFRKTAPNGFGPEYGRAKELREAFWGTIPEWGDWNTSEATQLFLEWFRFGLFMKPKWLFLGLSEDETAAYWAENVRVVKDMLGKYSWP
ncbi:hypothetical protein BDW59DRAFT_158201 [Aspergillus cavernicola]|uniref:Aminoglycoside phosphotransferase domain-containing protein n=1 Tax=Aspergillus cavernicola TaxID=176166 RepID=A0ABR4ISL8_9EURO